MIFSNLNSNSGVFPGPSMTHVTLWSLNLPEKKNGCRSVNKRKIKTIVESVATSWFSCSLVQHTNLLLRRKWTNHVTERPHQSEWAKLKEGVVVRVSLCWDSYLLFSFLSLPLVTRSSPQTFVWWKLPPPPSLDTANPITNVEQQKNDDTRPNGLSAPSLSLSYWHKSDEASLERKKMRKNLSSDRDYNYFI